MDEKQRSLTNRNLDQRQGEALPFICEWVEGPALLLCMESSTPPRDTASAMSKENVELFRQAIDAFNRRDREAWLRLCEPEFENTPPREWPESGPMKGSEVIWDFFVSNMEPWEESAFEFGELIDAGDKVVAEQHAMVRGKSSGAALLWSYWHVLTVRDGKAVRSEWFANRQEALAATELTE